MFFVLLTVPPIWWLATMALVVYAITIAAPQDPEDRARARWGWKLILAAHGGSMLLPLVWLLNINRGGLLEEAAGIAGWLLLFLGVGFHVAALGMAVSRLSRIPQSESPVGMMVGASISFALFLVPAWFVALGFSVAWGAY